MTTPLDIIFQQTDVATVCGEIVACGSGPGFILGDTNNSRLASEGGTPGTSPFTVGTSSGPGGSGEICVMWEYSPAVSDAWLASNYAIGLNIDVANGDLEWVETYVCRVSSVCASIEILGTLKPGTPNNLGTTGGRAFIVNCSAVPFPGVGDKIYILLMFRSKTGNLEEVDVMPNMVIQGGITPGGTFTELGTGSFIIEGFQMESQQELSLEGATPGFQLDVEVPD
jgi:hypothetical protein